MDADINAYPGIFPAGSRMDDLIKQKQNNTAYEFGMRLSGDLPDLGIISEEWDEPDRAAIPPSNQKNETITALYDMSSLALMDFRIRWCRRYLHEEGFPYDKENIFVVWDDESLGFFWWYVSETAPLECGKNYEKLDPLAFLMMYNFAVTGPGYAGKILTHFRRADRLLDQRNLTQSEAISAAREWMLIGETWAEAKFVINHSSATISGEKVAGGRRNSAHATNVRHHDLRQKRFARMKDLVPSLGVENAARQCEAEGLGGWQAIRRQWDRFKKNPDT